jgi:23S rRNA (cytosine1962-C5)-methyltransferase
VPPPPCILHEDDDLLVVNKPPGWNTHAPAPHAGEGIYDWLRHREPRWASLAILHRLDRETSGVLVFGKSGEANRSLTAQFAAHAIGKTYVLVTDRPVAGDGFSPVSMLSRAGERYQSRPPPGPGVRAETRFRVTRREPGRTWLEAEPVTGRTHQIRVHAASLGFPVLGDALYGGTTAPRVHLHAAALEFRHPRSGEPVRFAAAPDFTTPPEAQRRAAFIEPQLTDAYRCVHGAADREPGTYRDCLAGWQLVQAEADPPAAPPPPCGGQPPGGLYFKRLRREVQGTLPAEASPRWLAGAVAPERFTVRENGVSFELGLGEGYSTGLFLDQRDNRRRFLARHVAAGFPLYGADAGEVPEVLNCFAYTCAFSVCAALGGARTTSLDLSRKYLDWGRRNFALNGLDPARHDFIYGDVFDWLKRLAKKSRRFAVIVLDPPTFSRSPGRADFRAVADYGRLVGLALPLLIPGGVLFAATNAARLPAGSFLAQVREAIGGAGRDILGEHYAPQPPDFPVTRDEPAYLKTVWLRIGGAG